MDSHRLVSNGDHWFNYTLRLYIRCVPSSKTGSVPTMVANTACDGFEDAALSIKVAEVWVYSFIFLSLTFPYLSLPLPQCKVRTPELDALRKDGVAFMNHYVRMDAGYEL